MVQEVTNEKVKQIVEIYKKYGYFSEIMSLLNWEMEVTMPEDGAERRGELMGFLSTEAHKVVVSEEYVNALVEAEKEQNLNETEKAILRISRKHLDIQNKLTEDFIRRSSEQFTKAPVVWRNAKKNNDFNSFISDLQKNVDLTLEYIDLKGYGDHPYDALLDDYEIGLDTKTIKGIFHKLIPATRDILQNKKEQSYKKELIDGSKYTYPKETQLKICQMITNKLGLGEKSSRLDVSAHPFSQDINLRDVRITTRILENDPFYAITSTIHEVGHALYMNGYSEILQNTPVGNTNFVLGLHESQSRSWENFVGRSFEFCEWLYPIMVSYYPWLSNYQPNDLYDVLNFVQPDFIRTEADQVTYNLHIALRFEIELGLVEKKLKVVDLPDYWKAKMKEYLGVVPEKDSEGILQDIHWSGGSIGYFPTYTLGNVYAAQLFDAFLKQYPDFFTNVSKGDFSQYLNWLRENIHKYGIIYKPVDLIKKVTGSSLDVDYLIKFLKSKYRN